MVDLVESDERQLNLLTTVVNFYFQRGWLTEDERHKFIIKEGLSQKKVALSDSMKTMKSEVNTARLLSAIKCINEFRLLKNWGREEDCNHVLNIVMSNLLKETLITKEEMLEFEQEMLMKSENEICKQNITWNNDQHLVVAEAENMELSVADESTKRNPMKLYPVIGCLLQYLNFEEIKKCRYISKEWASVGLKVLATRSKITLNRNSKTPSEFFQVFPDALPDITQFSAVSISGGDKEDPWTVKELNYFFERQGKYIMQLVLDELYLEDEPWEEVKLFNITPWLSKSAMVQPKAKGKTELQILNHSAFVVDNKKQFLVDSLSLKYVKHLCLHSCHLNIQDGIQITPVILNFSCLSIMKDGNILDELCLNDVFDLSNTIGFQGSNRKIRGNTDISLDLSRNENLHLEYLSLHHRLTVINWETCKWTVEKLDLFGCSFTEKTGMNFKNLCAAAGAVDFSLLPQSLEKLSILEVYPNDDLYLQMEPVYLQNLKVLHLVVEDDCDFLAFCQNLNFPNLTVLSLYTDIELTVDAEWIPETVKILKLQGFWFKNEQNKNFNLDQLLLGMSSYHETGRHNYLNTRIQTQKLVLKFPICDEENVSALLELLAYYFENSCQNIYVGKFDWEQSPLSSLDCPLRNFVDSNSKYYAFENQTGKAIDKVTFKKLYDISAYE